ncbi:recombinase family protein [Yersinia ruckeri]|uniref:recombinase family protein n=1 Tax=Yersinia ruckeri TaxID=29486 RepID=UPI002237EAEE|nr:recombinase family protein [Yersinia ruckeri]EKN4700045.1 recombinase family protein [Yersinia ruckeri]ELM3741009.1 recombinase family protein [Yersinia ruckeri]ELM3747771.1 recombinase family protein [Yersinia ruckeri]MCW6632917.1 recombinase family protein [Yersinia ruckeri]MCW6636909.1 recombinase family protein [Yersinia ruckeri]
MYIHGYLRASTKEQDALRAKNRMKAFIEEKGFRMASWYTENVSGASLQRPELLRLLDDAAPGDIILIEQVDRLSRLDDEGWQKLKLLILEKNLIVVSLDLPTSHTVFSVNTSDKFTKNMLTAINGMMLDMLAAIARKDYEDRRRRQEEGIIKAKAAGRFKGRQADQQLHDKIIELRVKNKQSIRDTARLCGVSDRTVIRVVKNAKSKQIQNE